MTKSISKFKENLNEFINSGLPKKDFCKQKHLNSSYFSYWMKKVASEYKKGSISKDEYDSIIDTMAKFDARYKKYSSENIDTDDRAEISYERDGEGKISSYVYKIYKRNKPALSGRFTRNEMNDIYRLYSYYGSSLTQREISRKFPELSLVDFKRILRAFNITKASSPFAPHMYEEYSEDELRKIQLREKENDFLKKAEEDKIKNNEKLLKKYFQENLELKEQLDNVKSFNFDFYNDDVQPVTLNTPSKTYNKKLILHLSDLHVGAKVESGSLYNTNSNWNEAELNRRLLEICNRISDLGPFDVICINLLGDSLDGMDNQTARRDHFLPQNMDNVQQVEVFNRAIELFIRTLYANKVCSKVQMYSVKCGNHDGTLGYVATMALFYKLKLKYPDYDFKLFDTFFGYYEFGGHKWVITHGKDEKFMKRGLPLNLDDKNKVRLYEWLDDNKIYGDNVHIIKGDLHSENINSCKRLDYRNVLSLFGASDYSDYNFSRNQYGCSYELIINDNTLLRGTFENI